MNHQEERLSAYVEGELLADEIPVVEQHLRECALCAEKVDALKRLGTLLSTAPELEPSPQFLPELMKRISHERKVIRFSRNAKLTILVAAAVILFVVLILKMQQEAGQTYPAPNHKIIVEKPHISPPLKQQQKKETAQPPAIAKIQKQEKQEKPGMQEKPPQLIPEKPEQTAEAVVAPEEEELSNEEVEMIANLDVLENLDVITNYDSLQNLDVALMSPSEESKQ